MSARYEDRALGEYYYGVDPLAQTAPPRQQRGVIPSRSERFRSDPLARVALFFLLFGAAGASLVAAINTIT